MLLTVTISVMYLPSDIGVGVELKMDGKVLLKKSISGMILLFIEILT